MTEFEKIATDCRGAADYYADKPGHVSPETSIDIYKTIQRLAEAIHKQTLAAARGYQSDTDHGD